jgi:hypothetical protein
LRFPSVFFLTKLTSDNLAWEAEQKLDQPPFDGPELKLRFGRHVEGMTGCGIFGYRI